MRQKLSRSVTGVARLKFSKKMAVVLSTKCTDKFKTSRGPEAESLIASSY